MRRAVWVTAASGKLERVWTDYPDVDVDVSDLVPEQALQPAWARTTTSPMDEAALADLLRRSRTA